MTTREEIQRIKELSRDHTPKQIATTVGVSYYAVIMVQTNPEHGIENPKREAKMTRQRDRSMPAPGCFDYNDPKNFF